MFGGGPSTVEEDVDPLKQTITYRHLLSPQTLNVHNPLRVTALIDSDAFYAACEQIRLGLDPAIPIAVQQWQGLIAINYPARKFGITRMMSITEAKKKCPELVAVHVATYKEGERDAGYWPDAQPTTHKVSLDHYRRESKKVLQVFQDVIKGGEIEKASIDEAFFDLTVPVREIILSRYPHVSQVPVDAPLGIETPLPPPPTISWAGLGHLLPINPPPPEPLSEPGDKDPFLSSAKDKEEIVEEPQEYTWQDISLAIGAELVNNMRLEVQKRLGYTTSAGIARNKAMAKLCASCKKPFGQTVLRDAAIQAYLHPMSFQKIRFLGGKLGDAIAKEYDAKTIGDLLTVSRADMQKQFGEESLWIYNIIRGQDFSEVKGRTATKSMMASKNIRPPIKKLEEAVHWLKVLSSELAIRLTETRETTPTMWPKTLVLHIRIGFDPPRSRQCPFPYTHNFTDQTISKLAEKLWSELVGSGQGKSNKVSNIALGFSGLDAMELGQRSIDRFFGNAVSAALQPDQSRPSAKRKWDDSQRRQSLGPSVSGAIEAQEDADGNAVDQETFSCPRCGEVMVTTTTPQMDADAVTARLSAIRAEHEDFHVAQDLQREQDIADSARPSTPVRKKPKKKSEGIAAYFQRG